MEAVKTAIQEAARLQRDEGILHLSSCFQWKEFEGDEQRQLIHQEFVYEIVMYSVQRGLPWAAVAQIANMSKELLPELRGLERSEALSWIQTRLSQCNQRLSPSHRFSLYDFIVQTYNHHQCLYQAFLKKDVKITHMNTHLEIHVPPHPQALSEGTDLAVWEKQRALKELMEAETTKLTEIHRLRKQTEAQIMQMPQIRHSHLSLEDRIDKQALESMVRGILQSEVNMVKEVLIKEISALQELLEIRLSQTTVQGGCSPEVSDMSQKACPRKKEK